MPYYQFPGSDFHDLNLDWLLEQMKNCLAEWASTKADWQALTASNEAFKAAINAEWAEVQAFVTNYFDNLDVSQEISEKLDAMAADGSLLAVVQATVESSSATAAAAWLAEHVTQGTGYVIDNSLTVNGAAADAFYTGAGIRANSNEAHGTISPHTSDLEHHFFVLCSTNYNTGEIYPNIHNRACSSLLSPLKYGRITATEPYEFSVLVYDSNKTYLGVIQPNGSWAKGTNVRWQRTFDFAQYGLQYYFRIQIRNNVDYETDLTYDELVPNLQISYSNIYLRYMNQMLSENALFDDVTDVHQWRNVTLDSGWETASTTHKTTRNEIAPWQYPYVYVDTANLPEGVSDIYMLVYILANGSWKPYRNNGIATVASAGGPAVKFHSFFPCEYEGNPTYRVEVVAVDDQGAAISVDDLPSRVHFLRSKLYRTDKKDEINILFIGNSLTQDAVAYLPYVLRTLYVNKVSFRIGIYYNGGYNLTQAYNQFVSGGTAEIFSITANDISWLNYSGTGAKTIDYALTRYKWDVICLQEYFNHADQTPDAYNNCVSYIIEHYTGGNPLRFVELLHAPKRDDAETVYNRTVAGCQRILANTPCEDCVNPGTAVYKALSTDLNNLGDQGGLSPDGIHTQEGLPCLLQTFVMLKWVLRMFGIENKSFYNTSIRITTTVYNKISVPGPNLGTGVIPGTNAQNLLAQQIAINASNEGRKIVIDAF